jgi:uncharacterized membrane protein YphA (DoxX/SURF4 family)
MGNTTRRAYDDVQDRAGEDDDAARTAHVRDPLLVQVGLALLVVQFLLAGFHKVTRTSSCDDAKQMDFLIGERCTLGLVLLIAAGVWEIVASLAVIVPTLTGSHAAVRKYALLSLAVFTVLVTVLFKLPIKGRRLKYYGLMGNLSTTGGLLVATQLV